MKYIYSGNMKSISALVEKINSEKKFQFFPTNDITHARLKNNSIVLSGMFCKAIGQLKEQKDTTNVDLKVRLKRQFTFIGFFVLILLSGIIWGENVTVNGDSDPSIWKRIGFFAIGLTSFSIPALILFGLRNDFEKKITNMMK